MFYLQLFLRRAGAGLGKDYAGEESALPMHGLLPVHPPPLYRRSKAVDVLGALNMARNVSIEYYSCFFRNGNGSRNY